jgi:hypothetical protein
MIYWSFGEAVVEDLIAGLVGVPPVHAYSLTANINISSRCQSIRALARQCLDHSDFAEFESALGQFEALIPLRNKLVHGLWSGMPRNRRLKALQG